MIVGQDDTGASMLRRVDDDFPQREGGAGLMALMPGDMQATRLVIQVCDPQALACEIPVCKAPCKELARSGQSIELEREIYTLVAHATGLGPAPAIRTAERFHFGAIWLFVGQSRMDDFAALGATRR